MQHDRVLALGFFDGIHLGHAALLNKTRQRAQELGLTPAAMSFDTHPDTLVFGTRVPLLNTMAEREFLMRRLCGVEEVLFAHFDEAMMHMPWEVFVEDYLVRRLRARHVVCGHDFHFGDRGQGNPARLREKCCALGVGCDVIPEIQLDGQCVSSTTIRALLRAGDCKAAARLLGHGQLVTGIVQKGAGRGAGLGFPTANLIFSPDVLVPAFGVYRAEAELDGRHYPACVNIGVHPTLGALQAPVLEANLIGFSGNLYGKELAIWLEDHIRGELRFESVQALRDRVLYDRQLVADFYQRCSLHALTLPIRCLKRRLPFMKPASRPTSGVCGKITCARCRMRTFPRSVQLRMACFWRMCSYGRRKTSAILNILLFSRLCAATGLAARFSGSC